MTVCELRNSWHENSSCLRIRKIAGMKTLARKRRERMRRWKGEWWGEGGGGPAALYANSPGAWVKKGQWTVSWEPN
jgi:hypothetical protein